MIKNFIQRLLKQPRLEKFNESNFGTIEYFCTTQTLDKIICEQDSIEWNQELADFMDERSRCYFVVQSDRTYSIVEGTQFEALIEKHGISAPEPSEMATQCIDHYIKSTASK